MKFQALSHVPRFAALLTAGCLPGVLSADEIPAHPGDAMFRTGMGGALQGSTPDGATNGIAFVGRGYYNNHLDHYVVPFQLPDLGEGSFSNVGVRFRTWGFGDEGGPVPVACNLFAIPEPRPFSSPLATDVNGSGQNHTQRGLLIKASFLNSSIGINQEVATGAGEQAALSEWLNTAYQNGIQSGNFVFMRISPAGLSPDDVGPFGGAESGYGFDFITGNGVFGPGPALTYTFTPVDPNLPSIGSFGASPGVISPGGSSTLSWSSITGADTLTLNPGGINVTGLSSYSVSAASTTTYTLVAANVHGSKSRSLTLKVSQPVFQRGSTTTATIAGNGTSQTLTIAKPAVVQPGDVLIASISKNGNNDATTFPSGWAGIHSSTLSPNALNPGTTTKQHTQAFFKVADGTEESSFAFTVGTLGTGASNGAAGAIVAFGGVDSIGGWGKVSGVWYDTGGPFLGRPGTYGSVVNSTTTTAAAITTTAQGAALVMIGGAGGQSSSWSNWSTSTHGNLIEIADVVRQGCSTGIAWKSNINVGGTGNGTANIPVASNNASLLLALKGVDFGPAINSFTASPASAILPGQSAGLSWSVQDADSASIDNGIGAVDPVSGSIVVTPASTTTYTLTAAKDGFQSVRSVTVTVDVFESGPYRYYRMVPLAVRAPISNILSYLYLSEFHFTRDGVRVPAASVTSPGSSYASNAFTLDDGNATSLWYDFPNTNALPKSVFYDMGSDSVKWYVNGCRIGTSSQSPDSDLVSWRIDGSHDNTKWYRVDQRTNYRMPASRSTLTPVIPFDFAPNVSFKATPSDIPSGGSATLVWVVSGADSISIDNGVGVVTSNESLVINPPDGSTTYTLTASNGVYGTRTTSVTVIAGAQSSPVSVANSSFEDDPNSDPNGSFAASAMNYFTGWSIITMQNSAYPDSLEVLTGWQNLAPAQGSQALCLLAGVAVAQQTGLKWSDLNAGDQLKLTVAVGDRATHPDANPRWADESFVAFTDGLPSLVGTTPAQEGWLGNIVGQSSPVNQPPSGYKSGTMGDISFTYTVGEEDYERLGNVGITLASLGYRDGSENGADAPGAQSFWDNVRVDLIRAPGPVIRSFSAESTRINAGADVVLSWNVENAESVTISPLPGSFPATGSTTIVPSSSTVYTLSATNSLATKSREVRIDVAGPVVARYFRFTADEARGPYLNNYAAGVEISEIEILNGATTLTGASATSTLVKYGNEPIKAIDGNFNTSWWDFYLEPLTLDFGEGRLATGYRFATNSSGSNRDPVSWRVEGSLDGTTWFLLDERTQWQTPSARMSWAGSFATNYNTNYPEVEGLPVVESFAATPEAITEGDSVTLSWNISGADSVELVGAGGVQAVGTAIVGPRESINYYLIARNAAGVRFASVRIGVQRLPRDTIVAEVDDAVYETSIDDGSVVNGPSGEFFEILDVGRIPGMDTASHIVIPFRLPDLGPGGFVEAEFKVHVTGGALGAAGRIPVQLHAVPGSREDPWTLDTDVAGPGDTALTSGILIQSGFLNPLTPLDAVSTTGATGASAEGLGRWLTQAYASGANAGRYVFLRLSPDVLDPPDGFGFGISSADDSNPVNIPTLSYVFNPAGAGTAPVISAFQSNDAHLIEGGSIVLHWSVLDADAVEIDGLSVAAQGSLTVSPSVTTTYTITASNTAGQRSRSFTQSVLPQGSLRYLRFTSSKARVVPNVNVMGDVKLALTEFQIFDQNGPIAAADAGVQDIDAFGGAGVLVDGSHTGAAWFARATSGFVIDYRRFVVPQGYRLGSYSFVYDPVSWTIESSLDGSHWTTIDQRTDADAAIPETGNTLSDPFHLFEVPEISSFSTDSWIVQPGGSANLSWSVAGAESVSIDNGIGPVGSNGSVPVSPATTTTYTLSAVANGVMVSRSVRISVDNGNGLTGYVYDDLPYSLFYTRIQPITNLEQQDTLAATFIQSGPIQYPVAAMYSRQPADLPGLTSPNSFAVVWKGWFDATIDGPGTYTFGTASSGGSTVYLDLNNDGDFADAGELVLNNNLVDAIDSQGKTASVNLTRDFVRIAVGYWENAGSTEKMEMRFGKGTSAFRQLQLVSGDTGHFVTAQPAAPFIRGSISAKKIAKGQPVTLSWTVEGADTVAIDNGIGSVVSSGSLTRYPQQTTTYGITATGSGNTNVRSFTVTVTNGGLLASTFDTLQGETLLFPITNLLAQTPTTSFMQSEPVDYPTRDSWVETLPGITDWDNFTSLWQGVFNPSVDGIGDYTFGVYSGTGCVIYIDRNADGDFADAGEKIVERRGFSWGGSTTATVNLDNPNGHRIAIAFTDDDQGGPKTFSARFKKGAAVPYGSLDIISGDMAHFVPTLVTPPPPPTDPVITVTGSISAFSATYGSASPVSAVSISAVNLVEGLAVSAPSGFQVSTAADSGFAAGINVGAAGALSPTFVHVRMDPANPAGAYSGSVTITSSGAVSRTIVVSGTVAPRSLTVIADPISKIYGGADPVLTYSSSGLVGSDALSGGLTRQSGEDVGTYAISLGTLANANYSISFTGSDLSIAPKALGAADITFTRNGNSYTASADGVGGFTYSYSGRNGTSYGPSADAPSADGDYSVTATVNDSNYSGSKSEDFSVGADEPHPAFSVTSIAMAGTVCTMVWESQSGATYIVEATDNPADPQSWAPLGDAVSSQGAATTLSVDLAQTSHAGSARLFMRVRTQSAD